MSENRKITLEHMLALEETSNLVGKINAAWGDVQYFIYTIFVALMCNDVTRAKAIFFAIRTDRAQRDVTLALAETLSASVIGESLSLLAEVKVILERANKLAGRRNDAIHAMWGIRAKDMTPGPLAGSSPRLAALPIRAALESSLHDISQLSFDLTDLYQRVDARKWPSLRTDDLQATQPAASPPGNDHPHNQTDK